MNDYLWDGTGQPDPGVVDLETHLAPLRYRRPLDTRRLKAASAPKRPYAAIAAAIVLGVLAWRLQPGSPQATTAWAVTGTAGHLYAGQKLLTGSASGLTLQADDFGQVDVQPNSQLRVVESSAGRQRMTLERGGIHALIWAPPRQFVVDTPSARAIDLGCEYNLSVDGDGNGFLTVETGWVAFQFRDRESFIPAGAACRTSARTGPGVPFFQDAPAAFRQALADLETHHNPAALDTTLAQARPKDGLSLWHLLTRVPAQDRRRVFDRFAQLVPLPGGVDASKAAAGDPHTLDLCWNALQLEDAGWWREWKREWKP